MTSPRVSSGDDHNVEILPEGSLQNVRPEDLSVALAGLEAPAVIVVKSGDPGVEAAAVRLLNILRYCKDQLSQVESNDRRYLCATRDAGEANSEEARAVAATGGTRV